MKTKKSLVGQFLISGLGESDDPYGYIKDLTHLIGEIVIEFNALENDIDHFLCSMISDRSHQKGLLVINNMMFSSKVDLFYRFANEYIRLRKLESGWLQSLVSEMKQCGSLRNSVVHANWMNTDNQGYTELKIKYGKKGLEHNFEQFSKNSMKKIIEKIISTRSELDYCITEKFEEYSL